MFLSRLVYFSRPSSLGHDEIEEILRVSVANNYLNNVTGVLFFNGSYYVQVLEGAQTSFLSYS